MNRFETVHTGREFFISFLFIGIGILALLDNLEIIVIDSFWSYWPFIFVFAGISIMLQNREFGKGLWWCFFGFWLYVSIHEIFGLGFGKSWPLLIVAWGIRLIGDSLTTHVHDPIHKEKTYA